MSYDTSVKVTCDWCGKTEHMGDIEFHQFSTDWLEIEVRVRGWKVQEENPRQSWQVCARCWGKLDVLRGTLAKDGSSPWWPVVVLRKLWRGLCFVYRTATKPLG